MKIKKEKYDKHYYRIHPCTDAFTCKVCGWPVVSAGAGTDHRNHCPNCLYSIHLDNAPGDRESDCHGRMEPISVWVRKKWRVGYYPQMPRLTRYLRVNRVAADDNPMKLIALAMRPFAKPAIKPEEAQKLTRQMEGPY